jgi:hypothetical protein
MASSEWRAGMGAFTAYDESGGETSTVRRSALRRCDEPRTVLENGIKFNRLRSTQAFAGVWGSEKS